MPTHIDCFAGPGGICTGLHAAGFDTLVAIEYIKSCCDTYSANHPEVHVINNDIRKVTADDLAGHIPDDGVDLVTSGMPCETFSTAGNTSRSFYEYMNTIKIVGQYTEELQNLVKVKMYIESEFGLSTKPSKRGRKKVK